jgi:hypothetical protein
MQPVAIVVKAFLINIIEDMIRSYSVIFRQPLSYSNSSRRGHFRRFSTGHQAFHKRIQNSYQLNIVLYVLLLPLVGTTDSYCH